MSEPSLPVSTLLSKIDGQEGEKTESYVKYEVEPGFTIRLRRNIDPAMDPKKLKRVVSNRVAAQKSRWKKHQYVEDLIKKSNELQMQGSVLRSQLKMAIEEKQCLENEQRELEQCLYARVQRLISQKGEIEAYRAEIERLKNLHLS